MSRLEAEQAKLEEQLENEGGSKMDPYWKLCNGQGQDSVTNL